VEPELSITLKRSIIGHPQKLRKVLKGLGLKKIGQTVNRPDTPQVRGLVFKIRHLLEVKGQ
jgi:large subunit ribosomal protein L30